MGFFLEGWILFCFVLICELFCVHDCRWTIPALTYCITKQYISIVNIQHVYMCYFKFSYAIHLLFFLKMLRIIIDVEVIYKQNNTYDITNAQEFISSYGRWPYFVFSLQYTKTFGVLSVGHFFFSLRSYVCFSICNL